MSSISGSGHTEQSLKEELERLYVAAGYINADSGDMDIAMHLIGAAIAELEGLAGQKSRPRIRLAYSKKGPAG